MWGESARPVYVSSRPVGNLARAIGALVVAAFVGYLIYLSYEAGLATDSSSFLFYLFFVVLVVAAAAGIRGYVRSRTIEFYDDHVRVLGYDQDGQEWMDAPYSVIEVGSPRLRGRSGGSAFLLSIDVVPPMSWRVVNGAVKTSAGNIPLLAWIEGKKGSLTEPQRQADVQVVRDRLSSIDKKVRLVALGLSGLGTVVLVVGILFGVSGSRFIIVGAGLSTIGLFMLIVGLAFLLSRRMRPAALRQKEG